MRRHFRGFTLIELMIVVAIVGIIAAIAYPSYTEQVRRTARAECAGTIIAAANALERRFTATSTYVGVPALPGTLVCPAQGGTPRYDLTVATPTATTFTITATRRAGSGQANDRCGNLTYTNAGVKGIASATGGATVADCWR